MQVGHDRSGRDVFMVFDDRELIPGELLLPKHHLVKQISCGAFHSLLVADLPDGKTAVYSWGSNPHGQLGLPIKGNQQFPAKVDFGPQEKIVMVSAGVTHSAALSDDGVVWVWGMNENFQLGLDAEEPAREPVPLRYVTRKTVTTSPCIPIAEIMREAHVLARFGRTMCANPGG